MKKSIAMSAITSATPIAMIAVLNAGGLLFGGGGGVDVCTTGGGDSHNSRGGPHRSSLPEFYKQTKKLENK